MKSLKEFRAERAAKEDELEAAGAKLSPPASTKDLCALGRRFAKTHERSAVEAKPVPRRQSNGFGVERTEEELARVVIPEFRGESRDRVWTSGSGKPKGKKGKAKK